MSDRPCNYCTFKMMERQAKDHGEVIGTRHSDFMHGVDVFIRHPTEKPCYVVSGNRQWVCWFMELPKRCAC